MYSFCYLEPVCCSMSSSNCRFLTCIQISPEAGQVVWYSHLFQNFPQFIVIHTVKGFGKLLFPWYLITLNFFSRAYLPLYMTSLMRSHSNLSPIFKLNCLLSYPVLKILNIFCMCAESLQLHLTLCNPMDCSPPGSFVHGLLQARILEWVPVPSSRGSSPPRSRTYVSYVSWIGRWVLYHH